MQKRKLHLLTIPTLLSLILFLSLFWGNLKEKETTADLLPSQITPKETLSFKVKPHDAQKLLITAVGDIMVHESQWLSQKTSDGTFDFSNNFVHIAPFLKASDLSFANFESTIHESRKLSSFPVFNSPPEILKAMQEAGFTHVSTANNHSMDTGYPGITGTLSAMAENNLTPLGTYKKGEKKSFHLETVRGIKLGIAAYTTGYFSGDTVTINSIRSDGLEKNINFIPMSDPYDAFIRIKEDLDMMKEASVEAIILLLHWGTEYETLPNHYQKTLAKLLVDEGVHLIIGSHPHMLQEMEVLNASTGTHEGLVFYSLGNFLSNQRKEILGVTGTEEGAVARILLEKDLSGKVKVQEGTILPTWVNRKDIAPNEKLFFYEIIPLLASPEETSLQYDVPLSSIIDAHKRIRKIFHMDEIFTSDKK